MNDVVDRKALAPLPQDVESVAAAFCQNPEAIADFEAKHEVAPIKTEHLLHGGMYARTSFVPKGTFGVAARIDVPTVLIIQGDVTFYGGRRVSGFAVLRGEEGRRTIAVANEDTWMTTVAVSDAKSVDEAEQDLTHEYENLFSRRHE